MDYRKGKSLFEVICTSKKIEKFLRALTIISTLTFLIPTSGLAQYPAERQIVEAIRLLPTTCPTDTTQSVRGQLYSGYISATIHDRDSTNDNFSDTDVIDIAIYSRDGTKHTWNMKREEFEDFVRNNPDLFFGIFFPTSLSEGTIGKDMASQHSQQFLEYTVLGNKIDRQRLSGLVEYEWFVVDATSGTAVQGIIYFDKHNISVQGRYAAVDDYLATKSGALGIDYFPHLHRTPKGWDYWLGVNLFISNLYSGSKVFDLGVFDAGLGFWGAIRKDISRFRIGLGSVFQTSKSFIPNFTVPNGLELFADLINKRNLDFNLTYGTILGFEISRRISLNGKITENHSFTRTEGLEMTSQTIFLTSVSCLLGKIGAIDAGFKLTTGLEGVSSHSVFIQGNYAW